MLAEQPKNDELAANQLRFDIPARGDPAMSSASAKVGLHHEIKIDESHRVVNSPTSGEGYTFYVALIVGLLATTCGVRAGSGCLNKISASISGASAKVRPPCGKAAG